MNLAIDIGHARLGPSNHRWPHCPGSVREEAPYPDISGEAAIDGTGSHLLLEMCLVNNVRAEAYDREIIGANHKDNMNGWLVGPDRVERVQMCLDYVSSRVNELQKYNVGCKVVVEAECKSDPGGAFGRTDWWGTCDITITVTNAHGRCVFMEVIDYKDGRGWVDAKKNTQLLSYLFGKLRLYICSGPELCRPFEPGKVTEDCMMTIVQPKTNPVVRHDSISTFELVETAIELSISARATDDPEAELIPDDKGGKGYCRWCKHKSNCSALDERDLEKVKTMATELQEIPGLNLFEAGNQILGDVAGMPVDQLTQICDAEPGFMSIFDKARAEIQRRIDADEDVPGWAMQPGNGANVWNDTNENIAKALKGRRLKKGEIYPEKLISPAAVLKLGSLNKEQKARIEKELIVHKVGTDKLTRVMYTKEKSGAEEMFAGVDFLSAPVAEEEVSFI